MHIGIKGILNPFRISGQEQTSQTDVRRFFITKRPIYHFPFSGLGFSTFFPDVPEMVARGSLSLISPLFLISQTPLKVKNI